MKEAHDTGNPWPHLEIETLAGEEEILASHGLCVLEGSKRPMDE